jgi:prevent-host-death family protein
MVTMLKSKVKRWQVQEAKAKFSRVLEESRAHGPQIVTRNGKDIAAVISIDDLPNVLAAHQSDNRPGAILECLQRAPKALAQLDLRRDKTPIPTDSIFE